MTTKSKFAAGSMGAMLSDGSLLYMCIDEDSARLEAARRIKPHPICPKCKVSLTDQEREHLYTGESIVCRHCGKKHKLTTGTVFAGSHTKWADIITVVRLHDAGEKPADIAKVIGWSPDTVVRLINNRLGVV